jgi:hypothetical protein
MAAVRKPAEFDLRTPAVEAANEALQSLASIQLTPYQADFVRNALHLIYLRGGIEAINKATRRMQEADPLAQVRLSTSRPS